MQTVLATILGIVVGIIILMLTTKEVNNDCPAPKRLPAQTTVQYQEPEPHPEKGMVDSRL